ncbi:MAG: hypothetical protein Q8O27_00735 [Enterobacteriaceae bacterium]|nr:hypothetical protein [Enterobacteriaceae bacterium]
MTINMSKYESRSEFIKACKKDPLIKPLLDSKHITDITEGVLKKYNINPEIDGFFRYNQIFDLSSKIKKGLEKQYGKMPNEIPKTPEFEFLKYIIFDAPVIKRFLLITLSDKFNKEIKKIRTKYNIREDGFSNEKQSKLWMNGWRKRAKKELKDMFSKNIHTAFYEEFKRKMDYKYSEIENYLNFIHKEIEDEAHDLFWKYELKMGFIPPLYILWDFNNKRIISFLNDYNKTIPFKTPDMYINTENGKISWGIPKDLYCIAFIRPATKTALEKYIDDNWPRIKKEMNIFYKRVPLNKNFKRDWLVYKYHKMGKTNKEISGLLKFEYKLGDFTKVQIKQTIARIRKRITNLEKVT